MTNQEGQRTIISVCVKNDEWGRPEKGVRKKKKKKELVVKYQKKQ